jgi:phosphate transport system substrate-binding protein
MNTATHRLLAFSAVIMMWGLTGTAAFAGRIVIAGHGPELPVMQDLGRAFEKTHPGTAVDFDWDRTVKAAVRVKAGEAQVAVTDQPDPELKTIPIAWDGIAIIVNFANPVNEVTTAQVRDLFTGKMTRWADLDGGDQAIEVIPRSAEDNMQFGLETSLGIAGRFRATGTPARTDEKALRAVSGRDRAISYLSLAAALKAQEDGIPIRILTIDKVEAGQPTVRSGQYPLRRRLFFLTARSRDPLTEAFIIFVVSSEGQKILQPTYVPLPPGDTGVPPAQLTGPANPTPPEIQS